MIQIISSEFISSTKDILDKKKILPLSIDNIIKQKKWGEKRAGKQ